MLSFFQSIYRFFSEDSEDEYAPIEIEAVEGSNQNEESLHDEELEQDKSLVFARNSSHPKSWLNCDEVMKYINFAVTESESAIQTIDPGYFEEGNIKPSAKRIRSIAAATEILWPVSRGGHWYLIMISKNEENKKVEIRCLDGFNNTQIHDDLLKKTINFLKDVYAKNIKYKYSSKSLEVRGQSNMNDCGVVICHYAKNFCVAPDLDSFDSECAEDALLKPKRYSEERKEVRAVLKKIKSDEKKAAGKSRIDPDLDAQHVRKKAGRR